MNKSVLIVTPFFAPQSHAAVFRAHKLAKYLPRIGWKPYVLTVDANYQYNEDPGLLEELPPEVEIATARYIEPTLRGARMALGGRDRTFRTVKTQLAMGRDGRSEQASLLAVAGHRVYSYAREHWLQTPDSYWTWYHPALRKARRLVAAHNIPIVYTTCLPYTCNNIGRALQRDGLKWIADFREPPPTYLARMSSPVDRVYLKQRGIERETVRHADSITTTSSAYELIFRDMFGGAVRVPINFIPTGLDDDYLRDLRPAVLGSPYLIFAGEYLPEYGREFFEAFAIALRDSQVATLKTKLLVIGREEINRVRLQPLLTNLGITEAVDFRDHMPQRELYSLIKGALGAVIIPGRTAHWWNNFAKMVDYIALRVPCLAIVPDHSEARVALMKARLGIFLDGDPKTNAQMLIAFLTGSVGAPIPNHCECDRYLASNQARSFVDIFEGAQSC